LIGGEIAKDFEKDDSMSNLTLKSLAASDKTVKASLVLKLANTFVDVNLSLMASK
jgi:hypothetical protein